MSGIRLDEALVARGLLPSRARARDAVLRGTVSINGAPARKPAQKVVASDHISLSDAAQHYVSRAALKLIYGLDHFAIDVSGLACLDLGASTGGFTEVLLERGAAHVTAIDVGHGQMAESLAGDPRITLIEGLNARHLAAMHVPPDFSLVVCDVSFISLLLALPPALALAPPGCRLIALIKPQFEVGREGLGKGGIVTDAVQHTAVCQRVSQFLTQSGWRVEGIAPSPLAGGDGNREFLIAATKPVP